MSDDTIPGPLDYGRAARLLIYSNPDHKDYDGINCVISELHDDNRIVPMMLSLCDLAHIRDRELRTERGIGTLRIVVAELVRRAEENA